MKQDRPQRVLCVLGMHRSGTSCLTGSLQQGGLFLGKHHTWNEYNRKGNRENQDVVNINEAVFKANGMSWKKPLPAGVSNEQFVPTWEPQHKERVLEIMSEYAGKPLWGFKDPRTLMVLNGWHALVPDMEFVGIYRHPLAVAKSLANRPAMPVSIGEGLEMWYLYNRELLRAYEKQPFPVLCFDWGEERFHHALDSLHAQLKLAPVPVDERFYTQELHKQSADMNADLPPHIRALYEQLEKIVMHHESYANG